jgi:hypothetical protein
MENQNDISIGIDLTRRQYKVMMFIVLAIAFCFASRMSSFFVYAILIASIIGIDIVFVTKILYINSIKIRYRYHWSIKWNMVENYTLDENIDVLDILLKDGTHKQIKRINPKKYELLKEVMDDFLKSTQSQRCIQSQ